MNTRNTKRRPIGWLALAAVTVSAPMAAWADEYRDRIEPFAKKYCVGCHNAKQAKGELDLTRYGGDRDVVADFRRWNAVVEFIRNGEMPPKDRPQPTIEERKGVVDAVEAILLVEARRNAGDPGAVPPRRLSNAEYDISIRDLTGVAIRATAEFPVDPAGGEGFNNTGEALGMTPNLLVKYLGAADVVSKHLVLKPGGIAFAPFPVTSYNERKKLTEQAIIDFYRRHDVRIGDYLEAAWRYRHRAPADRGVAIDDWASRQGLSGKYLALVSKTLDESKDGAGYIGALGDKWRSLPAPADGKGTPPELLELEKFIAFVQTRLIAKEPQLIRPGAGTWPIGHLALRAEAAAARGKADSAALKSKTILEFGRFQAKKGEDPAATTLVLRVDPAFDGVAPGVVVLHRPTFTKGTKPAKTAKEAAAQMAVSLREFLERENPDLARRLKFGAHPRGGELDADSLVLQAPAVLEIPLSQAAAGKLIGLQLVVECELDAKASPESAVHVRRASGKLPEKTAYDPATDLLIRPESQLAKRMLASSQKFCEAFPNRFSYVHPSRGLAAGFHLVEGFFRDDRPLVERVLDDAQRAELDRLWQDLDFVTQSTETLLRGFVWFERAERHVLHDKRFDFLRAEDPLLVEDELLSKFERVYLEKMGVKLADGELRPASPSGQFDLIHGFFKQVRAGLTDYQRTQAKAEELALADIERLAGRAYGRALRPEETAGLRDLHRRLRKQGQGVEESLRGTFAAVLMSPHFLYRVPPAPPGKAAAALSDDALARRLSYFLWSSIPDEGLVKAASEGKLRDDAALRAEVRRMMKDPKIEAFAREFFGQWLRYRDYLATDTIPAGVFSGYDQPLREAMFEEPTRILTHWLQRDASIDELLHGDATFVNDKLAAFYGGAIETQYKRRAEERAAELKQSGQPSANPRDEWHRVEGLRAAGRGGLFGMPVVLARNSAGQRTSPVKRGFWVVHHLLGQHFPPPPADVPELPKSEKESAKTIREMLAQHTTNRSCAMCHVHFDGLGLTMEGFDAVGRSRTKDLAGRPVESVGIMPGGKSFDGVAGLIDYVEKHRRQDFERTLCRKFLGYALGRSVVLSDQPLLHEMEERLKADRRFSTLFEAVVLSPQFRTQRGRDFAAAAP